MGTQIGPSIYYLIMALLVLPFIFWYIYHERDNKGMSYSLSFIAGGAIGNLIDRIRLGKVIDFIDVDIPDIDLLGYHLSRWWTFNIADAAISCAIVFLVINLLIMNHEEVKESQTSHNPSSPLPPA